MTSSGGLARRWRLAWPKFAKPMSVLSIWAYNEAADHRGAERPSVQSCGPSYWRLGLLGSSPSRVADDEVEDICSTGSWCVKFQVSAVAGDPDKLGGIVEGLNEWLDS